MSKKISIILLVIFVLGIVLAGFLILQKKSDQKRSAPVKPVGVYMVPFGIREAAP